MRIAVTGMGVVSPLGAGVSTAWEAMCRGQSGISEIAGFDTEGFRFSRGGEIRDEALAAAGAGDTGGEDRATRFMIAAAREAVDSTGLAESSEFLDHTSIIVSTNFGAIQAGERLLTSIAANEEARASDFLDYGFQSCADTIAGLWGLRGARAVLSLSCSSGTAAIVQGVELIRAGRAKAVVTGGYDALSRFAWSGLSALRTMTKDELRPFDKNRGGTIFSEGAAAIVIENMDHALSRGAPVLAEVLGGATNNNAHHMTAPSKEGEGSALVMRAALQDAGIQPSEVDHINTHGTGTKYNDLTETQAIKAVFCDSAYRIPITSVKSMTGHMMGAAGSIEAMAAVMTIRDGIIPPTINFNEPDPECDLDCVVNRSRNAAVRTVLSNSAGIGGCNAAVAFRKLES